MNLTYCWYTLICWVAPSHAIASFPSTLSSVRFDVDISLRGDLYSLFPNFWGSLSDGCDGVSQRGAPHDGLVVKLGQARLRTSVMDSVCDTMRSSGIAFSVLALCGIVFSAYYFMLSRRYKKKREAAHEKAMKAATKATRLNCVDSTKRVSQLKFLQCLFSLRSAGAENNCKIWCRINRCFWYSANWVFTVR